MYVIGGNGSAHRTLQRASALQRERERDGGERLCLTLRGQRLSLDYVGIPAAGREITADFERLRGDASYYLVDSAELDDCG